MTTSEAFSFVDKQLDLLDLETLGERERGIAVLPYLYSLFTYEPFGLLFDRFEANEITPRQYADEMMGFINRAKVIKFSQKLDNQLSKK